MIAVNSYSIQPNQTSFGSKSATLRPVDDVCRAVMREFPVMSDSKLLGFDSLEKKQDFKNYRRFVSKSLYKVREFIDSAPNSKTNFMTELNTMKKVKFGNCKEIADATYAALKMNGYNDIEVMWLYAYNPATKKLREIDHTVIGVNFKKPDNYKYCPLYQMHFTIPDYKHTLAPGNKGIIIDSWAGITGFGKNIEERYNHNKALIKSSNEIAKMHGKPPLKTLLAPGEKLCFVPLENKIALNEDDLLYLGKNYKNLILPKNKTAFNTESKGTTYKIPEMNELILSEIRTKSKIKNALPQEEITKQGEKKINGLLKKYGNSIKQRDDRQNFFLKLKNSIISSFFNV